LSDRLCPHTLLLGTAALLVATAASAAPRVTVSLVREDATAHKLGMPGVAVTVRGPVPSQAAAVATQLASDLPKLVYTRALDPGEPGDYDLAIAIERRRNEADASVVPFEAVLSTADGAELWRATGRAEVDGDRTDATVFAGIARNVLSALVRDGWLAPRYDPANPPPAAPSVHRD
jgi:hypothetical protein